MRGSVQFVPETPTVEKWLRAADVFVFPSLTDTFGLVMLEALACGVPVAAFPVQGPRDVILSDKVGCLNDDLAAAVTRALTLNREDCRGYALGYTWDQCARLFESHLAPISRRPSALSTTA
jgi:glycosyltransferase involved in cell wall biosynthesis